MPNLQQAFALAAAKYSRHVPVAQFDLAVNISTRYRYLFAEAPKVACSSIKLTLRRLELDDPEFAPPDIEDLHPRNFSPLLRPSQVGDLDKFLARKDVFKFCFVRNPYTRLLSAWLEKIAGNMPPKSQILLQLGREPHRLGHEVTFAEFVQAVASQPVSMMDPHWRVQYYQTFQPALTFDFVGRFESFDADFASVLSRLTDSFEPYVGRATRHKTSADARLADFYTPALADLVFEKYRLDFESFGYSGDLPR
jgi:dermatan 4-sulfotransferase 1